MGVTGWLKRRFPFFEGNYKVIVLTMIPAAFMQQLYGPFDSEYFTILGGSSIQLGWAVSLTTLMGCLITIPTGHFVDKYGRKRLIVIGSYLIGILYLFRAIAPDWRYIVVANTLRTLIGFYDLSNSTIFVDSLPKGSRGRGWATRSLMIRIVSLFSPSIGGYLYDTYGEIALRAFLATMGGINIVNAYLKGRYLEETLKSKAQEEATIKEIFSKSLGSTIETLRWAPQPLLEILSFSVLVSLGMSMVMPFLVLHAFYVIGMTGTQYGFSRTIESAIRIVFALPVGKLVDTKSTDCC